MIEIQSCPLQTGIQGISHKGADGMGEGLVLWLGTLSLERHLNPVIASSRRI
jgi:hypothetical protein